MTHILPTLTASRCLMMKEGLKGTGTPVSLSLPFPLIIVPSLGIQLTQEGVWWGSVVVHVSECSHLLLHWKQVLVQREISVSQAVSTVPSPATESHLHPHLRSPDALLLACAGAPGMFMRMRCREWQIHAQISAHMHCSPSGVPLGCAYKTQFPDGHWKAPSDS